MAYNRWLSHHGVKGQKWGEKNGPPYPLNSSISDGHKLIKSDGSPQSKKKYKTSEKTAHKRATRKVKTIFVSGSSKTQDEASGYYRKELPKDIQKQLDEHMRKGNRIIVGDAPGIDRQVQDYLNSKKYRNVEIYGPGKQVRYSANPKWKTNPIDDPDHEPGSKEWLAKKDIAMTEAADEGLAIVLDEGAKATRKNVQRLNEGGKVVRVYSLNKDGNDAWEDDWDRKWNSSYDSKNADKANDIYKSLSNKEKYYLTAEKRSPRYINPGDYGENGKPSSNVYSFIEQYKDTPVSVIDIWQNEDKMGEVSIAVRNGKKYRHKGYASRALENGLKYFYNNPEMEYLIWGVNAKNRPSIELAKKYGFTFFEDVDGEWHTYVKSKEAKHAMAYNRWMYSDELFHHGVKGQKWGERNGPPYPLDSSLSDGSKLLPKATGSPQTKKKYKTSEKTTYQRKKRQEKIESSPDYKEKHTFIAEAKRRYRSFKKDVEAQKAEEKERMNDAAAEWNEAIKRLKASGMPQEKADRLLGAASNDIAGLSITNRARGLERAASRLNEALNNYEDQRDAEQAAQKAARDAAKEHGTAEEVMKFRDTFSKEEWDSIANRLESEARVRKLLDKPITSFQNNGNSSSQSKSVNAPENAKLRKLFEKGTAREIYQNRDKFTVEQLEAVEKRLSAEEEIGKRASNQVFLTPERIKRLEQVRDTVKIMGDIALTANKVNKAFNSGNTSSSDASDKKAQSGNTSSSDASDKKAQSGNTSSSDTTKKKSRVEMSGVKKDAVYSVKFAGSDKIHKVVGSKLQEFVNKDGRELENAYVADEKKKNSASSKTSNNTQTKQKPSYDMANVLKVLKTVEQVSIDEEHVRKYREQRATQSSTAGTPSKKSTESSRVSDLIDALSKVELIMVDESRVGKVNPLERIPKTFTDEEHRKNK